MKKLLGNKIEAHLKNDQGIVVGILFDIEDEYVYIQAQDGVNTLITVPKNNIKFYVSDSFQNTVEPELIQPNIQPEKPNNNVLIVAINGVTVTQILVPPGMNLATCSEEVLKLIWGDLSVQNALKGRVQTSLEYHIGYANIITTIDAGYHGIEQSEEDSFSMGANSVTTNPIDVAKIISGGKK